MFGLREAWMLGIEDDLRDAVMVAKVDENQTAVIAAAVDPAVELDVAPLVGGAKRAAGDSIAHRLTQRLFDPGNVIVLQQELARKTRTLRAPVEITEQRAAGASAASERRARPASCQD